MKRTANLIGALALGVEDRVEEALRATQPDRSLAAALSTLAQNDGLSVRGLSEALRLTHAATVRVVDRLEAAGWARRGEGRDGRTRSLHLTAAGRRATAALLKARGEALAEITGALTAVEARTLETLLEKLLAKLTRDVPTAYALCRLCDIEACKLETCPVECAELAHRRAAVEAVQ
jgi:DNA-binding MarR family transcriptional regulator